MLWERFSLAPVGSGDPPLPPLQVEIYLRQDLPPLPPPLSQFRFNTDGRKYADLGSMHILATESFFVKQHSVDPTTTYYA